jgi:hypothetical protein
LIDRREQAACLGQASLVAPKPGEGARGTQLEQQRRLRAGDRERAPELTFGPAYRRLKTVSGSRTAPSYPE